MKKHQLFLSAILLMAMALPQSVFAYDFSAVAPSGDTLYYNIINSSDVEVTCPGRNNWAGFTRPTGNLTIPSTVTHGGITYNVTSIGANAFYICGILPSVTIPNSVTSIGNSAFYCCTGLTSVTIPNSVTSIGNNAFDGCIGLTSVTIPNSVTTIGQLAFLNCTGLTSVTIPNSVTSIGNLAFNWVRHIEYHGSATGSPWGALYMNGVTDGDYIFSDSSRTNLLVYIGSGGSVSIPSTVTSICVRAFYRCFGLTSITIPNSVTSIGDEAFQNCTGLTSVTIPNSVTFIGHSAFNHVKHIVYHGSATGSPWEAISMNGVVDGDFVFSDNTRTNLLAYIGSGGAVTIPNSVTSIGNSAFYCCTGLTSVTIPNSVTSIGYYAFNGCSGLTTVNYNAINCTSMGSLTYPVFYGCGNLSTLIIGNSVINIPAYTFYGRSGLTSITIGSSVTSIDYAAFADCINLASVTVRNDNPPTLDSYSFYNVPNTCSLIVPCESDSLYRASSWGSWFSNIVGNCSDTNSPYYDFWSVSPSGDTLYYIILDSNSVTVVHPFASDTTELAYWDGAVQPTGTLTIPGSVTHNDTTYNVVRISEHAFYNCSAITSVTIPNTVDSIGEWAFAYSTGLTSVTLGNAVTTIGYGAFYGCTGLSLLVIPDSLTTIGSHAFTIPNCHVSAVSIPNTVTTIGEHAFSGWNELTSLTIPRSVTYIGDWAFAACTSLATVNFNADSCTYMGSTTAPVFDNDIHIQTLNIGNTVKTIPANAFYGCSGIGTVTIPASVSTIGSNAFAGCSGLTSITAKRAIAPLAGANAFANIPTSTPVYIPCGSTASYASRWSHFSNFIEVMDAHVRVLSIDATMGTASVVTQPSCASPIATIAATPNVGYLFAHWSDGDTTNPRSLSIDRDTVLTAFFVLEPDTIIYHDTTIVHDTIFVHDTTMVYDTTYVDNFIHDTTIVHDTSYVEVYVHDTTIVHDTAYVHDTTIVNMYIHDTIIVNNYIYDTAYVHDTTIVNNYIHDTVIVNNYIHDTTFLNNYIHDTVIVDNYIHDTIYLDRYIYDTIYIHDTIYLPGEGIDNITLLNAKIYQRNGQIVVEGAEGNPVYLYDVVGRLLATRRETMQEVLLDVPATGAYLVKIGDAPARRIVVKR